MQAEGDSSTPAQRPHRGLISRALPAAVRLWLRSQVEHVEDLEFQIEGGDRQILSGHIPAVHISASRAIYQGLHLSQLQLTGSGIRVNLGQVLRGKPLRLLEVVPVRGYLVLTEADLNASLEAPLLANAVTEFLITLLQSGDSASALGVDSDPQALNLQNLQVRMQEQKLLLAAQLVSVSGEVTPLAIRTGLQLANGKTLQLAHPEWLPHANAKRGLPLDDLHGFTVDLGTDVDLQELRVEPGRLVCQGCINVIPA